VFRSATAAVMALITSTVFSAPPLAAPTRQPTEVKIVSVPAAQPTEVKIIPTPPLTPAEVKVVSVPVDESAHQLVTVTWVLVVANALLCAATFGGSWLQSNDTKRRDRLVMEREIKRGAQKNLSASIWLHQVALEIPALVGRIHRLATGTEVPEWVSSGVDQTLKSRQKRLSEITDTSLEIVSNHVLNFKGMSDKAARRLLSTVDLNDVELESMREAIISDRTRFDKEISALLQKITAMQTAEMSRW
jgi:hypothetical protein